MAHDLLGRGDAVGERPEVRGRALGDDRVGGIERHRERRRPGADRRSGLDHGVDSPSERRCRLALESCRVESCRGGQAHLGVDELVRVDQTALTARGSRYGERGVGQRGFTVLGVRSSEVSRGGQRVEVDRGSVGADVAVGPEVDVEGVAGDVHLEAEAQRHETGDGIEHAHDRGRRDHLGLREADGVVDRVLEPDPGGGEANLVRRHRHFTLRVDRAADRHVLLRLEGGNQLAVVLCRRESRRRCRALGVGREVRAEVEVVVEAVGALRIRVGREVEAQIADVDEAHDRRQGELARVEDLLSLRAGQCHHRQRCHRDCHTDSTPVSPESPHGAFPPSRGNRRRPEVVDSLVNRRTRSSTAGIRPVWQRGVRAQLGRRPARRRRADSSTCLHSSSQADRRPIDTRRRTPSERPARDRACS